MNCGFMCLSLQRMPTLSKFLRVSLMWQRSWISKLA
ncbi:hypothetical protein Godav_008182 [Gossypium davidsonii]|uniref:Uncharacterized protein n=1 Tax=Gossypium davidsonii TaxID=34287 RepID=A0A7J8S979_GOSDV|nr:hypothetical protein [Gossypium davidsonii]